MYNANEVVVRKGLSSDVRKFKFSSVM